MANKKKAKKKIAKLPVPRLEFDEECGNVTLYYKRIDSSDKIEDGSAYLQLAEDLELAWATNLAKQLNLPLFANVTKKQRVV